MLLREYILRLGRKAPTVQAALCVTTYPAGVRRALLAMVRAEESQMESAILSLLQPHGWHDIRIIESKQLEVPFLSDDREVRACYVNAVTSDGGVVVYTDPVEELEMASPYRRA
jgi:hypothetical protein